MEYNWIPTLARMKVQLSEEERKKLEVQVPPTREETGWESLWRGMPFNPYYWQTPQEQYEARLRDVGVPRERQGELAWRARGGEPRAPIPSVQGLTRPELGKGAGERFMGEWVAPSMIPGGLMRQPLSLAGKLLPQAITKAPIGKVVSKGLDILVGKVGETRPPIQRGVEELAKTKTAQRLATEELGAVGKGKVPPVAGAVSPVQPLSPIDKLLGAYEYGQGRTVEAKALYKAGRKAKFGKVYEAQQRREGAKTYFEQMQAMEGAEEIPEFKLPEQFKVQPGEMDDLLNKVLDTTANLKTIEKTRAQTAVRKLFGLIKDDKGRVLPMQDNELDLIKETFPELWLIAQRYRSMSTKAWQAFLEVTGVPKAIMSSTDFSFTFRQGALILPRKPQLLPLVLVKQVKSMFSPKYFDEQMEAILKRPRLTIAKDHGLYLAPKFSAKVKIGAREEWFPSSFAERIPIIGHIVKASNRSFAIAGNYLRASYSDDIVGRLEKQGLIKNDALIESFMELINVASGRGSLGKLNSIAPALNVTFFSPRWVASRLQFLGIMFNPATPAPVRKEAWRMFVSFMGVGATALGLAKLAGAEVEWPSLTPSSNMMKIKIGNTRYDVWAGYLQWARFITQLAMNKRMTTTTGEIQKLDRIQTMWRLLQSKGAPLMSIIVDLMAEENYLGDKMFEGGWNTVKREVRNRLLMLSAQDFLDALESDGLLGAIGAGVAGGLGVGITSYKPKETGPKGWPKKLSRPGETKPGGGAKGGWPSKLTIP